MEPNNEPVDALEEPPTDYKAQIEEIYNDLPKSMQQEYKSRLQKHGLENDFETEHSYNILEKLNAAYQRKRERSRQHSKTKREQAKLMQATLNIQTKPRGRPKKVTPVAEPKSPPPPAPEELPEEPEEEVNEELNELLEDLEDEPQPQPQPLPQPLPQPEPQPPQYTPIERLKKIPSPPPLQRHSLVSLFNV